MKDTIIRMAIEGGGLEFNPKEFSHIASLYCLSLDPRHEIKEESEALPKEVVFVGLSLPSAVCVSGGGLVEMQAMKGVLSVRREVDGKTAASRAYFKLSEAITRVVKSGKQTWHKKNSEAAVEPAAGGAEDGSIFEAGQEGKEIKVVAKGLMDGCVGVDLGASPGGWTQCLLHKGCVLVYAIDPGHISADLMEEAGGGATVQLGHEGGDEDASGEVRHGTGEVAAAAASLSALGCDGAASNRLVHMQMKSEDALPLLLAQHGSRFAHVWVSDMNRHGTGDSIDMLVEYQQILKPGGKPIRI
jgi:hypothetical protein